MADFTSLSLNPFTNPIPGLGIVGNYDDLWDWVEWLPDDFGWWCLGHNFDVVGAILSMANLSWQKGFDAGRITKHFNDDCFREYPSDVYAYAAELKDASAINPQPIQ